MGSCVNTLRRIQSDVGITDKELKRAVHEIATPREVTLKEISMAPSKKERKLEQRREFFEKKVSKERKRECAVWYLEEFVKLEFAMEHFYMKYDTVKEIINAAYEAFLGLIQLWTFNLGPATKEEVAELFNDEPEIVDDDFDIPESQWKAYGKYLKKHPLKTVDDIPKRRKKFLKSLRKRKRKYYSKKRISMYDPLYAASRVDEKEMLHNLELITAQNDMRIRDFHEMLESLYKNNGISQEVMKKFGEQTDNMAKHHRQRLREFRKRMHRDKPTPVTVYEDDLPPVVYDDWDDPNSIDSVLKKPIGKLR